MQFIVWECVRLCYAFRASRPRQHLIYEAIKHVLWHRHQREPDSRRKLSWRHFILHDVLRPNGTSERSLSFTRVWVYVCVFLCVLFPRRNSSLLWTGAVHPIKNNAKMVRSYFKNNQLYCGGNSSAVPN